MAAPVEARDLRTPLPPVDVTATTTGDGTLVSWQAPLDDGGSPVGSYHVYRRAAGLLDAAWEEVGSTDAATLSFTDRLTGFATYAVTAENEDGQSLQSTPASTQQEMCDFIVLSGTPPQPGINWQCNPLGPPGFIDYLFEIGFLHLEP